MCRIASRDLLSASGNASPQTKRLPVALTSFRQPLPWLPRQQSTVFVDSENKAPTNEQPNEINRRWMLIERPLEHDWTGGKQCSLNRPNRLRQTVKPRQEPSSSSTRRTGRESSINRGVSRRHKRLLTTEVCPHSYLLLPFCKEVSLNFSYFFCLQFSCFLLYTQSKRLRQNCTPTYFPLILYSKSVKL